MSEESSGRVGGPEHDSGDAGQAMRPALGVASATLISRVLGLVRDKVTVFVFPTALRDAIVLAWTVPNLFRRLFGEGALAVALVPTLARIEREQGPEARDAAARSVISALVLLLVPLCGFLLAALWLVPLPTLTAPFDSEEVGTTTIRLLRWMLPYLVFVCVAAQFQAVANLSGRFFLPAVAPALTNLTWILGAILAALLASQSPRPEWVAAGVLLGGVLQVVLQWAELRRAGIVIRPAAVRTPAVRDVARRATPMLLGLAASQINLLVDRGIAESFIQGDGAVTNLYLGNRLMQLPLGLIGVALSTAAYPVLARASAANDRSAVGKALAAALRMGWLLGLPATVGLMLLARPVMSLLFEGGSFDAAAARSSAACLSAYLPCVVLQTLVLLLARVEYSRDRHGWVVRMGVLAMLVNVALDFLLVTPLGAPGLALATSLATALNATILAFGLRLGPHLRWWDQLGRSVLRVVGVVALVGIAVFAVGKSVEAWELSAWIELPGPLDLALPWRVLVQVSLGIGSGLVTFFVAARILAREELHELQKILRRGRHETPRGSLNE